jgi:hypothetical protein
MRYRTRVAVLLFVGLLVPAVVASTGDGPPARRWATAYLTEPTLIGSTIVQGPVLFVHDDGKMARGEPCTSIRLFDPARGPIEEIMSFHCIPTPRRVVTTFTVTTRPNADLGFGCVLTEYQFAGDAEGHGVPAPRLAH